jgi:hypothetical protein
MAETATTVRARLERYGIAGPVGVALLAGVVYFVVHELFHMLLGVGPIIDTVGSIALGAVAAAGVYALAWNRRTVVAAFVGVFAIHTLVMGYGGVVAFAEFGWSMPMAVAGAVVFFLAAGGLGNESD